MRWACFTVLWTDSDRGGGILVLDFPGTLMDFESALSCVTREPIQTTSSSVLKKC